MHIISSSWELALFRVVAPELVSIVKPVAFGHLLPHQYSSDIQGWDMERHINKTTRSLGTGSAELVLPDSTFLSATGEQMPNLECLLFLSLWKGSWKSYVYSFQVGVLFHVSLLQNWHSRSRRNTFRRNPGGCALFSSVRFVINRKGCEAKIAESTPLEIWVCFFKEGKCESSPFKIVTVHYP